MTMDAPRATAAPWRSISAMARGAALLAVLLCPIGCAERVIVATGEPLWKLNGPTMGTRYSVSLIGGDERSAKGLQKAINDRLAVVNQRMSTYDPESELSRFNASESTDWFPVSAETASVVATALELSHESDGAFDPTVGPLVNLWGFGPDKRRLAPPSDETIATAQARVGHQLVEARLEEPALRKQTPDVYLDLSAIAKGHGVDVICELLQDEGVEAFMVEIGGEVRAHGLKPGDKPWRIGVERVDEPLPGEEKPRLQGVVALRDRAMATSGDYRNFFKSKGVRYSHTIDPKTGRPVTHDLATVTVLADTCREADGLATTLLVLGPTEGYDWAVEHGVAALLVSRSEGDVVSEQTTPAWDETTTESKP